uniref:Pentraxin family member n=1 Tax=Callorhinchus milii TaxID=7868 RepID=A0A4W3GBN7_CALMI
MLAFATVNIAEERARIMNIHTQYICTHSDNIHTHIYIYIYTHSHTIYIFYIRFMRCIFWGVFVGYFAGQKNSRPTNKFQITFPLRTNYMYAKVKKSLPEMYAMTVCLWLKSNASPGVGTPFSYAIPGQPNELVLIEWGNNPMEILINDKVMGQRGGGRATRLLLGVKGGGGKERCRSHIPFVTWLVV